MASPFPSPIYHRIDPNQHMNPNRRSKSVNIWIAVSISIVFFLLVSIAIYCYIKAREERRQQQQQQQQIVIEVVAALPRRIHQAEAGETEEEQLACSICLEDFQDQEELVELPGCRHLFHDECVRGWLSLRGECPYCRAVLL